MARRRAGRAHCIHEARGHHRSQQELLVRKPLADSPAQLLERRFEDPEADPQRELRRVYEAFGLSGWDAAQPAVAAYLGARQGYRKNACTLRPEDVATGRARGGFAADRWGYAPPA